MNTRLTIAFFALILSSAAFAAQEGDYYKLITLPIPEGVVLEVGGLTTMPGGRIAASTRHGEIYVIDGAYADPPEKVACKKYADGLHEPLGLIWRDGSLYTMQRAELTRLRDNNADDKADEYDTIAAGWGVTGAYHEYGYGPVFDREGNMHVTLNCTMGKQLNKNEAWRGWSLRIKPDGAWEPWAAGMRSPSGIGINAEGDVFFTDQQGTWVGTCTLRHIEKGSFHGYAEKQVMDAMKLPGSPIKPFEIKQKIPVAGAVKIDQLKPPAVWFPYRKMGMSATGFSTDLSGGKFGPFENQIFVGDFTMSLVLRVYLEKVKGQYQGAVFRFREGFQSAVFRTLFGEDGSLFVGQTNRGWNSLGNRSYGLQRLVWTGKTPFEIQKMEAKSDGFLLTFTQEIDPISAADPASYELSSYTYEYHATYGSEELDPRKLDVRKIEIVGRNQVRLTVDGLRQMYVHELIAPGVKSIKGEKLLHDMACYTLNAIP